MKRSTLPLSKGPWLLIGRLIHKKGRRVKKYGSYFWLRQKIQVIFFSPVRRSFAELVHKNLSEIFVVPISLSYFLKRGRSGNGPSWSRSGSQRRRRGGRRTAKTNPNYVYCYYHQPNYLLRLFVHHCPVPCLYRCPLPGCPSFV